MEGWWWEGSGRGRGWWWVDWGYGERGGRDGEGEGEGDGVEWLGRGRVVGGGAWGRGWWWEVRGRRQGQVERWSGMVGKGKGEEVAVRAGRVFTDAAPLLLGSAENGCETSLSQSRRGSKVRSSTLSQHPEIRKQMLGQVGVRLGPRGIFCRVPCLCLSARPRFCGHCGEQFRSKTFTPL